MGLSDYRQVEYTMRRVFDQLQAAQLLMARGQSGPELRRTLRAGTAAFDQLVHSLESLPLDHHTLVHMFMQNLRERLDGAVDLADAVRLDRDSTIRLPTPGHRHPAG
jgi:hypothetical protein